MRKSPFCIACAAFFAYTSSAVAADFHPLESMTLAGGIYEYDNILITAGVTLSFEGEDRHATLRARDTLTLAGNLVAPGWTLVLEAHNLQLSGQIDVGGNSMAPGGTLIVGRGAGIDSLITMPGGDFGLGGRNTTVPKPTPASRDLGVGGNIVIQGPGQLTVVGGMDVNNPITIQTPVPEPETWAMLLAGLGLVGLSARRRLVQRKF